MFNDLLLPMFDDGYYPEVLVAEVKQYIVEFAKRFRKLSNLILKFIAWQT